MIVHEKLSSGPRTGRGTMTTDRFRINLGKEAVKLALDGNWARAVELNRAILELCPDDCEATNRLAKALMELADYSEARKILNNLLARHPSNNIARKNLARLEKLETVGSPRSAAPSHVAGPSPLFIEDGGKSCTTTLRSTGDATALADVVGGDTVALSASGDTIVVNAADGRQLGTVEPRLARRLRKLIAGGNQYSAAVVSISGGAVSVAIRETQQHPSLRNVVSFPPLRRRDDGEPDCQDSETVVEEAPENVEEANLTVDSSVEPDPEQEDALPTLATDEMDDDDADDSDPDVPVLDADDVDDDPISEIVRTQEEDDWE